MFLDGDVCLAVAPLCCAMLAAAKLGVACACAGKNEQYMSSCKTSDIGPKCVLPNAHCFPLSDNVFFQILTRFSQPQKIGSGLIQASRGDASIQLLMVSAQ